MARLPRFALAGQPQHVIQRGNNRCEIFRAVGDYRMFFDSLAEACLRYECGVHAYVLMPNHFHLLITPRTAAGISGMMQSVGCRYVKYFNAAYQRTGTLWEGRYRAAPVDTERYLLRCYRYIELNPVRAGMVGHPDDYLWSSHRANAFGHADPLVTPHKLFHALGSDAPTQRMAYRALFQQVLDDQFLREIRESTNKSWVIGGERFHSRIASIVPRPTRPAPRGGARIGAGKPRTNFNGV